MTLEKDLNDSNKAASANDLIRELDKLSRTSVGILKNLEKKSIIDYDALNNLMDKIDTMSLRRELQNGKRPLKGTDIQEDGAHQYFMSNYQKILKKHEPKEAPNKGAKPTLAVLQSNKWLSRYEATPGKYNKKKENEKLLNKNATLQQITTVDVTNLEPKLNFQIADVSGKSKGQLQTINEEVHKTPTYAFSDTKDWRKENQLVPWRAAGKSSGRGYLFGDELQPTMQELPGLGHRYQRELEMRKSILKDILSKPVVNRTAQEDDMVYNICKHFKMFSKLPPIVLRELCTVMNFVKYEQYQVLCGYGDVIPAFHIIVNGKVRVEVEMECEERVRIGSSKEDKERTSELTPEEGEVFEEQFKTVKRKYISEQVLQEFDHFGDTGLISFEGLGTSKFDGKMSLTKKENLEHYERRSSNIRIQIPETVPKQCECIVIEKSEYDRAIRQAHVKDIEGKVSFLSKCKPFKKWATSQVHRLVDLAQWQTVEPGSLIMDQGHSVTGIYFIREGECSALRKAADIDEMDFSSDNNSFKQALSDSNFKKKFNYVEMGTLKCFDFFGEYSTLTSTQAKFSVMSKTKVSLACIPKHIVPEAIDNSTVQYLLHRKRRNGKSEKKSRKDKWQEISQTQVDAKFLIQSKQKDWMKYKESVVKDVINRKNARMSINSVKR